MKGGKLMRELHNTGWYVKNIRSNLPNYVFKPVPTRLLGGLAYTIVIVSGIMAISLLDLNIFVRLLISLVLGFSFSGVGFLAHEILHGTVVKRAWLKNILGGIAFLPLTVGPRLWTEWHNISHHGNTQHEDKDPDAWLSMKEFNGSGFVKFIYKIPLWFRSLFSFVALSVTFTLHSVRMFFSYIKTFKGKKHVKMLIQFIIPWVIWIGLLALIGPEKWMFAYLIPFLIGNFIVMCYISTNHRLNPLVPINDPLANSLTVTVPKWLDILHFNFSYHTEHHLFPGINPKYYGLVKKEILRLYPDRYHEMPLVEALKLLYKTPRIYYNNDKLIDPIKKKIYNSLESGLTKKNILSK